MTHFLAKPFRVHVDAPSASENELEETGGERDLCVWQRRGGKYLCVHERARKTDKELNEPTRGPNLANFLKTHLRPVFLLSERPPSKRWRFCCVIEAGSRDQSRGGPPRDREIYRRRSHDANATSLQGSFRHVEYICGISLRYGTDLNHR